MLYAHIVAAVFSALRIALFNAFDAIIRPPDINIWEPGEYVDNSTLPYFEMLSTDATDFGIPALLVLKLAVIPPPPPSVTVIAIHPSKAHSSLGHTFHLGSLFQMAHCAYEAPQFVSAQPSRCVAFLKPTPISTAVYIPPTPVIPSTERPFLPSATWSTGLRWHVWTMVVNTFRRIVPWLKLVAVMLEAIAIFWSISFCAHWVLSGVTALITHLPRVLKNVKDHVSAAQWSTAWFKLVQVDVSNELKSDISVFSPRFTTLLHVNANHTDLVWTIAIGPEPLPYTLPEDVEDVEKYIFCSVSAPLSPALISRGKALNAPLSTGSTDPANIPLPFDADVGIELNPADVPLPFGADIGIELDPTMVPLPFDADAGIEINPADVPLPSGADIGIELDPTTVPLPFDADAGIALDPATVPLPHDADEGIELDPTMVPLPFDADVGIAINPADVPLPSGADIGIELDPTTVPLPFDADVGIALDPATVPLPHDADDGIELDPTMVPLPFDADVGIALDPATVPLPHDADEGIELDPTTVPLPFDADVGIELDASPSPTNVAATREESQTSDNKKNELEVTEASSITDTDGSLEHSLLGMKPIATAAEDDFECHSVRSDDSKYDAADDNQSIAYDGGDSTLVDSVDLDKGLSICSPKLLALDTFSDGICKPSSPTTTITLPTELGPALGSAANPEDSTKMADQEEELGEELSIMLYQDVGKESSLPTTAPSPALVSDFSFSAASTSVPSSSDSSSLSADKGKGRSEEQMSVLDDASAQHNTEAGQTSEEPAPKKNLRRTRGKGKRINYKHTIILEVVGEDASQSATGNAESPQASGSGLLLSQRDPPSSTLAAAGTGTASVQRSQIRPGPQASGSGLRPSHRNLFTEALAAVERDASSFQRSPLRRGPQASGSDLRPSQYEPPTDTLEARRRATPAQGERSGRPINNALRDGNGRNPRRQPPRSSSVPDAHRHSRIPGVPPSARLNPGQEPSSSGQRERERHGGWRGVNGSNYRGRLRNSGDERGNGREQDRVR